jgi:hypothetical protein
MDEQQGGFFSRWFERSAGRPMKTSDKIIIGAMLVAFLFVFYVVLDANKYRAQVQVIEGEGKVGVNPTTESLDFGDLSRGTSAVRRVSVSNGTRMPMYVMVWEFGSISDLMEIEPNYFRLKPGEERKIDFSTYIPASAEIGKGYRGRVYLFKVPTFWL